MIYKKIKIQLLIVDQQHMHKQDTKRRRRRKQTYLVGESIFGGQVQVTPLPAVTQVILLYVGVSWVVPFQNIQHCANHHNMCHKALSSCPHLWEGCSWQQTLNVVTPSSSSLHLSRQTPTRPEPEVRQYDSAATPPFQIGNTLMKQTNPATTITKHNNQTQTFTVLSPRICLQ